MALGVQYGHLRGYTTDGYGSRVASGLRDIFPMEEALARADYLEEDAHQRLEDGEQVSGPAADRYTQAIHLFDRQFRGRYMSNKQAAALRAIPNCATRNGSSPAATTEPKRYATPTGRSQRASTAHLMMSHTANPDAATSLMFDQNIDQVVVAIAQHEAEIDSATTPIPLRGRLEQRITALHAIVNEHQNIGSH